jgi:hypothetical protein
VSRSSRSFLRSPFLGPHGVVAGKSFSQGSTLRGGKSTEFILSSSRSALKDSESEKKNPIPIFDKS